MKIKLTLYLPTSSRILIGLCAAGVLGFVFLVIVPDQKAAEALDSAISETQLKLKQQELLSPLYHQLQGLLKASKQIDSVGLPFPREARKAAGMGQRDIDRIHSIMQTIVEANRLKAERIEPDVSSLIDNSGKFRMTIAVRGEFMDFRKFILHMAEQLPSMEHIETIQIERVEDTRDLRLELGIWIAQK